MNLRRLPLTALLLATFAQAAPPVWEWAGWGGGGFYYSAAFSPTQDGVLYLGGDVCGVYKSSDHGQHFRLVNHGLADYGVFSLAVDPTTPDTVYAATAGGLCKSVDGAEHWRLLPNTGRKGLRLTGEKGRSIRCVAIDPSNSRHLYAASPGGKLYQSADGGETWQVAWERASEAEPANTLRVQFGKVNDAWFGGFWSALTFPAGATSADCTGFAFDFKGDGTVPQDCFLVLKAADGTAYRSRNLRELFKQTQWGEVLLGAKDFALDPDFAKKNPAKAQAYAGTPDWATINRWDFACVGPLMNTAPVGKFNRIGFALKREPSRALAPQLAKGQSPQLYGNCRLGTAGGGALYSVTVAQRQPSLVAIASEDCGALLSRDGGATWRELPTPKKVAGVAIAPSDPTVLYAACFAAGLRKSTDGGATWADLSAGLPKGASLHEVAVSPANPNDVYAIGSAGWSGRFYASHDGGTTWAAVDKLAADLDANPTLPANCRGGADLSTPENLTINPFHPDEMYIAANWRSCHSANAGRSWTERVRGADISCIYDVRFVGGRTYACAMDEGVLASDDGGAHWRALWPLGWDPELSGHAWRLAVDGQHVVATCSPWDGGRPNRVVISDDGGQTFKRSGAGLPTSIPTANTMWGQGYARALAADPRDPRTLYLGIDGDPAGGKPGGGVFKSTDGGLTWAPLPGQPGSRRMFFGLAVDPTDSQRLWWAACGTGGGVWRSEDGGGSWANVFKHEQWLFNVHVAADGTIYAPGRNLWRSTDHGKSWKQLTKFADGPRVIVAVETDPADAKRLWCAATTWDGSDDGAVYESVDDGASWQEIGGELPYRKPLVLRYNAATHELWSAGVCLFKCKR